MPHKISAMQTGIIKRYSVSFRGVNFSSGGGAFRVLEPFCTNARSEAHIFVLTISVLRRGPQVESEERRLRGDSS